jgi:hypothetical protein
MGHRYDRRSSPELEEYQVESLIQELDVRGYRVVSAGLFGLVEQIYMLRRCNQDYQRELEKLLEEMIGRY